MSYFFWFCAVAGLVTSTGFLVLTIVAAIRFRVRKRPQARTNLPLVTLLKPLYGLEPNLEANLASFFAQDYPQFEIIFGTRDASDPALEVVRTVQARYPDVPVKIVFSGEPDLPSAKICSLLKMYAASSTDYLVISDSDVEVAPDYLRNIIPPLLDPKIGLVTCPYRGTPTGGLWAWLEALGMSVELMSGVIVADLLEGMKFALGPTMAIRRDVLDAIGGFGVLASYHADDYVLGREVHASGKEVVLSHHAVDHIVAYQTFKSSMLHQISWMRSTRWSRPKGHVGTVLTFAMPFGLLALITGLLSGHGLFGAALFAWAFVNRIVLSIATGWGVVRDRRALLTCWLYPLRDLLGFIFWCASFTGRTFVWRGQTYRFEYGGSIAPVGAPAPDAESRTITVDKLA